jgi:hypothetical protein
MKTFVTTVLLSLLLLSCTKELSFENQCGTVDSKFGKHAGSNSTNYFICVRKGNAVDTVQVCLIAYDNIQVGDMFCKQ